MRLVIASSLSQLAVGGCDSGGFHRRLDPLSGLGTLGLKVSGLGLVLLAEERQMRPQIIIAGGPPFGPAGKCRHRFLTGIQEVRNKSLVLHLFLAAAGFDRSVIRHREFWIPER